MALTRVDSKDTLFNFNFYNQNEQQFNLQLLPKEIDSHNGNSLGTTNISNDLTGNTLMSTPEPEPEAIDPRRLSISGYHFDKPHYYEYEFLNRDGDGRINDLFETDISLDTRFKLTEDEISSTRKVMNYFKLNIFSTNSNSQSMFDEQAVFKKRYFWNRNKKSKNDSDDINKHMLDIDNFDNDMHAYDFNDLDDDMSIDANLLISPAQLNTNLDKTSVENESSIISDNSVYLHNYEYNSYESNDFSISRDSKLSSPPQTVLSDDDQMEIHDELNKITTMPKRIGTLPKTRGRKPSPILDPLKLFACEHCDRRFKRQEHLKRHVRSLHMGEKPFSCHICEKKFSRSDNLNQHIKTHSNFHK
ncbi:hypothetical protein Kpol_1031p42 [Vanderwaltozyma polyspora DSM 70294]|uniref:C2H2-type domain-containing protein n=1 Tax=Vanderwaltozyma polyspora (strain ATCC 22028 / DSM 70294 / BCRC 21397 / CBS 2163 / NBRC 10782 / NRRL Y-8283 / UCD 57-17) TaxID=436907 RepID=A7THX4_VANPO|nr:uncharacterized protein Kpol_1031p42 [Vanderwaltozyma polyspora DSM 70294]EDO18136.1 hypothetical protein Kpol_1031p42 [Vanderwaltozyma polyspora DSM 70294]